MVEVQIGIAVQVIGNAGCNHWAAVGQLGPQLGS